MAGRGPQSYQKRQKEMARKEKQQEKMAKRLQRKQDKQSGLTSEPDMDTDSESLPAEESEAPEESLQGF